MAITSKQRAQLRALAQNLEVVVHIGKEGVTPNVAASAEQALLARSLSPVGPASLLDIAPENS